jgi:hypothetical protein
MSERDNCTGFVLGDWTEEWARYHPCHCPKCGGFLPSSFPTDGKQFTCKKCGSVLETIPNSPDDEFVKELEEDGFEQWEIDEMTMENYGGRICLVPDYAVKKGLG